MDRREFSGGALALTALILGGCAAMPPAAEARAVDEAGWVSVNGVDQWVAIKGTDARKPVLLFLHGGPGLGICNMMPAFEAWTQDFTVALWDQPGGGATGVKHHADPGDLGFERYVRDGIAVAEHVKRRFGGRKIVLMGISWGSQLGVEMAKRRPDLFSAYVGTAQVTGARGHLAGYQMALESQRRRGNAASVAALERAGPPPYARFDDWMVRQQFTNPPGQQPSPAETQGMAEVARLLAASPVDAVHLGYERMPQGVDTMSMFMGTLRERFGMDRTWEIRDLGRDWSVPVFVFQGELDLNAPEALAREWLGELRAPAKAYEMIPGAGHNTLNFHRELHVLLLRHVLPVAA